MKKTAILFAGVLSALSLNLLAFEGDTFKKPLFRETQPFLIRPAAQEDDMGVKDRTIVTAGIGLNLLGFTLETRYLFSTYYDFSDVSLSHKSTPMFNVGVDYGLGRKVSIGGAFGYQTARIMMRDVLTYGDKHHDDWTRIHLAVRGDYYIVAKQNVSLYTGLKVGYNMYTVKSTLPDKAVPNYEENLDVYPSAFSTQAHFGFSYFVNGLLGFNAEVGLGYGGPYLFHVGATIKL